MKLHAIVSDPETARTAAEGGASVIQLRLKDATTEELIDQGAAFRALCTEFNVTFVVNDDVQAALALFADGVHLGQDDEDLELALEAGMMVGRSATTPQEASQAEEDGAAYIGAGPIWATPSKPDADPIGLDRLRAISEAVRIPVIAIGGIDPTNARECIDAGAFGVAVVRAAAQAAELSAAL
ncbi:MAG TPA: thiamine phosphate synthase [Gaiellaceae bacterium]|jgi:thiamine-phosphate pyrophosphorylase|nr:thiamine phosphate synthase [Gaiellaceae bacterium]